MKQNPRIKATFIAIFLLTMVFALSAIIGCGGGGSDGGGGGEVIDGNATVTGTVYDDQGLPLSGATVSWQLSGYLANKRSGSTTTNTNGEFALYNVSAGNILLTAVKGSLACQQEIYVESNSSTTAILDVNPAGQISGTVTDVNTQQAVSGAVVQLTKNDSTTISQSTDYTGGYSFSYVPEGTHSLSVTKSLYHTSTTSVSVTAGQTAYMDFSLYPSSGPTPSPTVTPGTDFTGKVHALIIGVNDYPGDYNDLNYCVADAQDARSAFQSSNMWSDASIYYITDQQATESNIINTINNIKSSAASDDLFVMTFSGHGSNSDGRAAICVWNDDLTDWGYINDQELATAIQGMPCASAIFIDSCYSGGIIGKNLTSVKGGITKTARVYTGAPGYNPNFKGTFAPKTAKNVETLPNLVCLTASRGSEVSWEMSSIGNGVFTYYYTEGLGSSSTAGPADTDGNNSVSAEELYNYSYPKVGDMTNGDQNPQMVDNYSTSTGDELPVKQ